MQKEKKRINKKQQHNNIRQNYRKKKSLMQHDIQLKKKFKKKWIAQLIKCKMMKNFPK